MRQLLVISAWVLLLAGSQAGAGVLLTFDVMPGPDGHVGTADDVAFTAPTGFIDQNVQLTNQFALDGILFTPNPSVNGKNEILNSSSFTTSPPFSPPNLLASELTLSIQGEFTVPIMELSALIGISQGSDRMEIFDASGASLGAKVGDDQVVNFQTTVPIKRFVVSAFTFETPAIDNLMFDVPEPTGAAMFLAAGLLLCERRRV